MKWSATKRFTKTSQKSLCSTFTLLLDAYQWLNRRSDFVSPATTPAIFDWHGRLGPWNRLCLGSNKRKRHSLPSWIFDMNASRCRTQLLDDRNGIFFRALGPPNTPLFLTWEHFTFFADHSPSHWILNVSETFERLVHWRLGLFKFDFNIQYK